ncbi:hypothetical protein [Bacillus cereus group sp. IBL03679]|uniref:hypothetical protein n=1 Tax=Bacillus cereus group sp. IBL03679 TaxID=3240095 RepID=UPI003D2F5B82
MAFSNKLIEQLELQAQAIRDQQKVHRTNIENYNIEAEEVRKTAEEKVKEETHRIEILQPELDNLVYAIHLLTSQMPPEPPPPTTEDPPTEQITEDNKLEQSAI